MSRRSDGRGGRGPIGKLSGLIGQGVGLAAEYNAHRNEQNRLRSASQQQQDPVELPADSPNRQLEEQQHGPPVYAESADRSEISLGAGQQLSPNEKGAIPRDELSDPELSAEDDESLLSVGDEGDWELDELEELDGVAGPSDTSGLPTYEQSEAMSQHETVDELVRQVVETSRHQIQTEEAQENAAVESRRVQLPCPVILPQRRPRKKQRGFVRAYAPVLKDCGIDQDTFMAFLKSFYKSSQASPIFPVIQVSAAIAGFAPSVIAFAVTTAVQIAASAGEEMQTRTRTNNFLDRMNEELFKPAGLYAMIVKYKSDAEIEQSSSGPTAMLSSLIKAEKVDLTTNQVIAKYNRSTPNPSFAGHRSLSERMQSLRLASDNTNGGAQFPVAAPLVFPELDKKLAHDGPETFKDKTRDAKAFLSDYLDRKAQMKYAAQDPDSALALPESQRGFKSSLADPNHPIQSGSLSALVTGGKLDLRHDKRERKRERRLNKDVRRFERGREPREGKRTRRYGDDYIDDLHARINDRLAGHQSRLEGLGGGFGGGRRVLGGRGPIGGLIRSISDHSSGHSNERSESQYGEGSSRDPYGRGLGGGRSSAGGRGAASSGPRGMIKRVLREDVLYLMIVNLPSEAELAEAREELGLLQRQG